MKWKVRPYFKWYDLWIGFYWDQKKRVLYVGYLPMCGLMVYKEG